MDIRRVAMTLPNQITESLNRLHDDDSWHFLEESQNTLAELESRLLAARDQQTLATEKFASLLARIDKIKTMLLDIKSRA
jgi:four helix bundle protein